MYFLMISIFNLLLLRSLPLFSISETTYSEISPTHFCGHRNGGYPARCNKSGFNQESGESGCKTLCTERKSCWGYGYHGGSNECFLVVSSKSCLSGWTFGSGSSVKSTQDFTVSSASGYSCHVKINGWYMHKLHI